MGKALRVKMLVVIIMELLRVWERQKREVQAFVYKHVPGSMPVLKLNVKIEALTVGMSLPVICKVGESPLQS